MEGIKQVGNQLIVTAPLIEVYIERYFFNNINSFDDNIAKVYGLFILKEFKKPEISESERMSGKLQSLIFPSIIEMVPSEHYNSTLKMDGFHTLDYTILKFYKNDVFIKDTKILKDVSNIEILMDLFVKSKFPYGIPYNKLIDIFTNGYRLNSMRMGAPLSLYEAMISEFYRDPKDINIPFRRSGIKNMLNYEKITDKELVAINNQFSAISYQDMDQMLIKSVVKTRKGIPDKENPIEKTIKY